MTDGFGLYPTIVKPPYTTLTAYDLNQGAIRWQIGLGDDLRLVGQGITGTGAAATTKGGVIVTGSGLLFATAADRKVHVLDSATGKQSRRFNWEARRPLRRRCTSWVAGSICSSLPGRPGRPRRRTVPAATGPTGIVAFALPQ